ncbi:hypothetical protein LK337_0080 [Lactococcus lactis subsp. lactis]|nr:hypothetical protein LK337_0080 [Lactococcus lactis subsp. lactis]
MLLILLVLSEIMGQIGRKMERFRHEIGTSTTVFADILVL